jgi:hypothetical protein
MKIDFSGAMLLLVEQLANLTRDEQRVFAQQLGGAIATLAKSSRTRIDDVALRSVALPFARFLIEGVEQRL